jgi:hypothetical protein
MNGRFRSGFCETIIAFKIWVNFLNRNGPVQNNIQHCALAHGPNHRGLFVSLNVDYYDKCLAVLLKTCENSDILITALCSLRKQHLSQLHLMMETEAVSKTSRLTPH